MLKKVFAILALAAASLTCGAAMAADSLTYKTTDGKVFTIDDVRKVTYDAANGWLVLTSLNGATSGGFLPDNGTLFNKIKGDHPEFLTYGTNVLYVQKMARWVTCDSSGTNFGWRNAGAESLNDGCVVHQQSLTKTNN